MVAHSQQLILLLDEFDRLLAHRNFQEPTFFALLRTLATNTGGLSIVTASRITVSKMNERGRKLLDAGSPFFNILIEIRLKPFDETTASKLLDLAGDRFSPEERLFIRRVAGRRPFLLQAMAATLLETSGEDRYARAAERFYERISYHFDDLWVYMDDTSRAALAIFGIMELGKETLEENFSYDKIEVINSLNRRFNNLLNQGLLEQIDNNWQFEQNFFVTWRGKEWTVSAQSFIWWVCDIIIAKSRQLSAYDNWLENKNFLSVLPQELWEHLTKNISNAPDLSIRILANKLFEDLVRSKR